jgi:MOSC domain-containing protein YiiM
MSSGNGPSRESAVAGRIHQINVSRGGIPKLPVASAAVTTYGLHGDYQRDQRNHGGPDRALCIFTLEEIQRLQAEGHPIVPGSAGENLTLEGIPLALLVPGARLAIADSVEIEITSFTIPCNNIAASFADGDFTRISHKLHPGESRVYARVLSTGSIHPGDAVRLLIYS